VRAALPLSGFWFLYLGGLGIFFPFYSLYLGENAGLTGTQVGIVLAMIPLVGIVGQPLWGQVADRSGARAGVLATVTLGAAAGHAGLSFASGFWPVLLGTVALAFFATAVIPQTVAVSFAARPEHGARGFGRVRVWGTVGFLLLVVGFPRWLDRLQATRGWSGGDGVSEPGLGIMFPATAAICVAAAAVAFSVPRGGEEALRAGRGDWHALIRHRPVLILLALAVLAYGSLQGPMGLFPLLIRSRGGSMQTVGNLWVLMLVLEIPLVLYTGVVAERLGPRALLVIGTVAGGVRWLVCGFADATPAVYAVQILHGVTVAGLVIGGPLYLEEAVPRQLRSTAQALLAMIGVGLGGVASNAGAGWLLEHVGPQAPYRVGGAGALVCGALILWLLPHPRRPAS
jgi:PPP family 3-phenylpropionic acid transporter